MSSLRSDTISLVSHSNKQIFWFWWLIFVCWLVWTASFMFWFEWLKVLLTGLLIDLLLLTVFWHRWYSGTGWLTEFQIRGLISSVQFLRFTDWFYGVEHIILRFNDWFDVTDCSVWEHSSFRFTDCFHVNTFILCFGLSDCFFRFHSHYFEFCRLAWCYWLVFGVGDILVEFDWLISDLLSSGDQQFFRFYWLTGFTLKSLFNVSVWVTGFKVSLTFS